jgi:hypothetical protein
MMVKRDEITDESRRQDLGEEVSRKSGGLKPGPETIIMPVPSLLHPGWV